VELEQILGIGAFSAQRGALSLDEHEHTHDPGLESASFVLERPFDRQRLEEWLKTLLAERGDDIFRMKGILALANEPRRYVLQGVHRMSDLKPADAWGNERPVSKLVFIGRDLGRAALERALRDCLA
jgi:G3E family GTPase